MLRKQMRRIALLLLPAMCGASLCLSGCSIPSWGRSKHTRSVPGVTAPHERIAKLREQRKQANRLSLEAAEQLAVRLASECGVEEDPLIRAEMVLTLGALKSPTAREALLASGQDPNGRVRVAVCRAWAGIADETASSELARILSSDMDQEVRVAAARGLGKVGGPHAVAALGSALEDRDPALQYLAMESLKQVSGRDYGQDSRLWKQYVQGQTPVREEKSIAQRVRDIF